MPAGHVRRLSRDSDQNTKVTKTCLRKVQIPGISLPRCCKRHSQ